MEKQKLLKTIITRFYSRRLNRVCFVFPVPMRMRREGVGAVGGGILYDGYKWATGNISIRRYAVLTSMPTVSKMSTAGGRYGQAVG